jgi:hypothetical protein
MTKMKLSNYQIWLVILISISIWNVMSVGLEILPLIPSYFSAEFATKLNQVFITLSYSILAAYIFYLVTSFLPRKILIYRSKKILGRQVNWFLYELFVIINQILHAFQIENSIEKIEEKDLLHLDGNISPTFKGYYRTLEYWNTIKNKGKQFSGFGNMPFEFPTDIQKKLAEIPESINKIRQSNPNFHVDETFAEILASIETSKIIEWYSKGKNDIFRFAGTSREMFLFIKDYQRLLHLNYHKPYRNSYHKIHFYSDNEIKNISKSNDQFHSWIVPKQQAERSLKPCIVYSSKYPDSKPIISMLNNGINSTNGLYKKFILSEFTDKITPPIESKCIVIIGQEIPENQIKEYIKTHKKEKVIIWLKSNFVINSPKIQTQNGITNFGLYKLFYRKPLKIWLIQFARKYPTMEIISVISYNVTEIMRNFKNETNETK